MTLLLNVLRFEQMLKERGLILHPDPMPKAIFDGMIVRQSAFRIETFDEEQVIVSMSELSIPLVEVLTEIVEYKPSFRYERKKDALVVVEWKKNVWSKRWDELLESEDVYNLQPMS